MRLLKLPLQQMSRSLKSGTSKILVVLGGVAVTALAAINHGTANNHRRPEENIYIGVRTDGRWGKGTQSDPFDGSTPEKFDCLMDNLPINAQVELQKNAVFLTNGRKWNDDSAGWRPKSGLHLEGNGSTIRLARVPNDWPNPNVRRWEVICNATSGAPIPPVDNVTIENLTVDANTQNLLKPGTPKAVGCIVLVGSNNTCRNVHVTNMYGNRASGNECFALTFSAPKTGGSNCWAIGCSADNPRGDWQAANAFFGHDSAHRMTKSGLINCSAVGRFQSGLVNLAYASRILVTGCYTFDSLGVYHDTGSLDHLVVKKNSFCRIYTSGVDGAVTDDHMSDVVISENYFEITNQVAGGHSYGITLGPRTRNAVIERNTFVKDESGTGYRGWLGIFVPKAKGLRITNNIGDATMDYYVKGLNVVAHDNYDFNATPLPSLQRRLYSSPDK